MWAGNGPWSQPQWPMQQALYQNIPHEEVDWAALAQQWIQMRESMSGSSVDQPPPLPPFPLTGGGGGGRNISPPPHSSVQPLIPKVSDNKECGKLTVTSEPNRKVGTNLVLDSQDVLSHSDNSNSQDESTYSQGGGDWGYWQTAWNTGPSNWTPPVSSDSKEGIQTFEYGHMHGNQGYTAQTYDYNHGSDQFNCTQPVPNSAPYNQYWTQGAQPPFLRRDKKENEPFDSEQSPVHEEESALPAIDAAKRKNLPAWIREGLEKMEREKQKKLDRERMLQERERRLKMQREEEERTLREMEEKPTIPLKSKFDSDSEDEGSASSQRERRSPKSQESSPVRQRTPSPIEAPKTEQEKVELLMLKVRQLLTEILLEVTNEEILLIAKDTLSRSQAKAPALQLAKSSALSSIAGSFGGLGGYGSDSEVSEAEGSEDSDELEESIRKKRVEFAKKERELGIHCQSDMSDEDRDKSKILSKDDEQEKRDGSVPRTQSAQVFLPLGSDGGKDKYHFEKTYVEIPGLGMIDESEPDKSTVPNERLTTEEAEEEEDTKVKESDSTQSDSSSSSTTSQSSSSRSRRSRSDSSSRRGKDRKRSPSRDRNRGGSPERRRGRNVGRSQTKHGRGTSSSSRSRDRGRTRRSYSRGSSSRSRSHSKERTKGMPRRDSYRERNKRVGRHYSRSRSRSRGSVRRSQSPSFRRSRRYGRSRSRSRSPRPRPTRYSSRYSRSPSRDRYDQRLGKKSSRKPRV